MLNAIDLFSGYGGITLALKDYSRPIIYCEIEKYCQGIILSRMDDGALPFAPIWEDVTTLDGTKFRGLVDIVYGGFPCQDISTAGRGEGLDGQRSGLFYEVVRICKEASPEFIFLENVPAIRTRGSREVQESLASIGYDSRFGVISAAEVGANHKRERWFCLSKRRNLCPYSRSSGLERSGVPSRVQKKKPESDGDSFSDELDYPYPGRGLKDSFRDRENNEKRLAHAISGGFEGSGRVHDTISVKALNEWKANGTSISGFSKIWITEPGVDRVANGTPFRVDRVKALGNGVVPLQVKTAFEILMGIL